MSDKVEDAFVELDSLTSEPMVTIIFTAEGAERFSQVTEENIGRHLAIMVGGKIYSVPVIRDPIVGDRVELTGSFTIEEANRLAMGLRTGNLPVPIKVIHSQFF